MVDFGLSDTVTVPPTWFDVPEWMMEAYYLPEKIVCNSWTKKVCAWFTKGQEAEDRNGGVYTGGDNVLSMIFPTLIHL